MPGHTALTEPGPDTLTDTQQMHAIASYAQDTSARLPQKLADRRGLPRLIRARLDCAGKPMALLAVVSRAVSHAADVADRLFRNRSHSPGNGALSVIKAPLSGCVKLI